ncbi:hypothetical protein [Chitinibacter sp. S2-10]|uniref:hypothetical protein n=1 Tax=Chitinibacter sp. S2-10 TaxID=3373597 RepID=UPI0039772556
MNTENKTLNFSRLWAALSAPSNKTAVLLMVGTFIAAAIVFALFAAIGRSLFMNGYYDSVKFITALGVISTLGVLLYGMNAVGLVLMADARQIEQPTARDAILISLATGHRFIGLALVNLAIVLLAFLAVIIALFICKIPGLGAFLYTFVYPITALLIGLLLVAQYLVIMPLAAPAIWDGHGVFTAMSRLYTLVRRKLAEVLMLELVLFTMLMVVSGLLATVLSIGVATSSSLSMAVLDMNGGMSALASLQMAMGGFGGSLDGYLAAYSFGSALLIALAVVIPALISTKGFALIFLQASEGVDFAADEAMLKARKEAAQHKIQQAKEEARRKTESYQMRTQTSPAIAAPAMAAACCPQCQSPVVSGDAFCGECGHRLS